MQAYPPPAPAIVERVSVPWIATQRQNDPTWLARHNEFVARAHAGGVDVIFLGDSITDRFARSSGSDVWKREIAPLGNVADFGIRLDRTEWLLWRVQHGELDGSGARAVVLMIGTNNLTDRSAADVAHGITAVVAAVRLALPQATVILNAVLPRGLPTDPVRAAIVDVNTRIKALADGRQVVWLDDGPAFLAPDGTIPSTLMSEQLHPTAAGYEIWAAGLRPLLNDALAIPTRMR